MPKKVIINGEVAKLSNEQETRQNMINIAKQLGCEQDLLKIFYKYDMLLKKCTNTAERQAISIAGNEEIHFLLSSRPGYILVGNKVIGRE